jgi:hypothetical protein
MKTRGDQAEVPQPAWDEEEERAFEERLKAAGFRFPTKSLDRPRIMPKKRPRWLAYLITLLHGGH